MNSIWSEGLWQGRRCALGAGAERGFTHLVRALNDLGHFALLINQLFLQLLVQRLKDAPLLLEVINLLAQLGIAGQLLVVSAQGLLQAVFHGLDLALQLASMGLHARQAAHHSALVRQLSFRSPD